MSFETDAGRPPAGQGALGPASERAEQLVVEVTVRDLDRSLAFYSALGFTLERRDGGFAALRWDNRRLFLDERPDLPPLAGHARANVRIITPDVDQVWKVVQALGARVERPLADRYYGLRDFTILDPDDFGLRFASVLSPGAHPSEPLA